MPIDIAGDISGILGAGGDLPQTSGTYAVAGGGTSDALTRAVLVERSGERLGPRNAPEDQEALLLVETAHFTNVTRWSIGDTFTPTGEDAWTVRRVRERQAHITFDLSRTKGVGA